MKALFHKLFSQSDSMPFSLTYPDRTTVKYGGAGEPKFNLIFKTKKAMRAMLINADLGFGEAYMVGDIEFEGKMTDLMTMVMTTDLLSAFRKVVYNPVNILRHLPSHINVFWNYLYQVIITPGIDNERPMTRDYLYAEESNSKGFNERLMQFDEINKSTNKL